MTDQTAHDVTYEDRKFARDWAAHIISTPDTSLPMETAAAHTLLALLPPRPTLAEMTPDEQDECTGMQADLAQGDRVVILDGTPDHDDRVQVLESSLDVYRPVAALVTPRPDLPRLTWPGDTPAPAPAMPEGWRLADHPRYGRVFVTTPEPDGDGDLWFIDPSADPGVMEDWCDPDVLTFLDDQGADQ